MARQRTPETIAKNLEQWPKVDHNANSQTSKNVERGKYIKRLIIKDICFGVSRTDILQKLYEDGYGLGLVFTKNTAERNYRECMETIRKNWEADLPVLREKLAGNYWDIVTEARNNGDRMAAIKALDQIGKISGAIEQRLSVNHSGNVIIDFGFDNNEITNDEENAEE